MVRGLIGASLLGQKKYRDAEPLLIAACEGMKERERQMPAYAKPALKEARERLVQLYEASAQRHKLAVWKQKFADWDSAGK
jgi:hypothetical protein